jgi:hypothetical protein
MHQMSLADELAQVRAELARLKLREARLRAAVLAAPDAVPPGRWSQVAVVESLTRVFDPSLLPQDLREDPRFMRERRVVMVKTLPVQAQPSSPRPGWPIRRFAPEPAALH